MPTDPHPTPDQPVTRDVAVGPGAPLPDSEAATLPPLTGSQTAAEPEKVPGYEILRELGRGAMGVVYLARQTHWAVSRLYRRLKRRAGPKGEVP